MAYQVGDYVYSSKFGVGRIREVAEHEGTDFVLDFERAPQYRLSQLQMRLSTRPVSPLGFRALAFENRSEAMRILSHDPVQTLMCVLRDYGGHAKTEEIKDYLSPYLGSKDWAKWWKNTQQLLKRSEYINTSKADQREYSLRTEAISPAEEVFRRFANLSAKLSREQLYGESIRVFNAYKDGASLSVEHRDLLRKYFVQAAQDLQLPLELRLDAIFRLSEVGWLTVEDREKGIRSLVAAGLKVHRLEAFAQNRILEFLFECPEDEAIRKTLLGGLCAGGEAVGEVSNWVLS